jgi:hypothetical protein
VTSRVSWLGIMEGGTSGATAADEQGMALDLGRGEAAEGEAAPPPLKRLKVRLSSQEHGPSGPTPTSMAMGTGTGEVAALPPMPEGAAPRIRLVLPKLASKRLGGSPVKRPGASNGGRRSSTYRKGMYAEVEDGGPSLGQEEVDGEYRESDVEYEEDEEIAEIAEAQEVEYAFRDAPLAQHRGVGSEGLSQHRIVPQDNSALPLKADHTKRPLYVCEDGRIILESFHPLHERAIDFLITIAEPITRTLRIHEYKISPYSLYAAVSVGMETSTILDVLERLCKTHVPSAISSFIRECTESFGKVKLVLKKNRYYIESSHPEILRKLLQDPIISAARDQPAGAAGPPGDSRALVTGPLGAEVPGAGEGKLREEADQFFGAVITLDAGEEEGGQGVAQYPGAAITLTGDLLTQSFLLQADAVEGVKRRCGELDYPLMEEYDFRNDDFNPTLHIDLSPKTQIRDYQEKCLSKMFAGGRGRARSGIIVLPTGAGKTLVGITAACTIKKSVLVLCTNAYVRAAELRVLR